MINDVHDWPDDIDVIPNMLIFNLFIFVVHYIWYDHFMVVQTSLLFVVHYIHGLNIKHLRGRRDGPAIGAKTLAKASAPRNAWLGVEWEILAHKKYNLSIHIYIYIHIMSIYHKHVYVYNRHI